ncbi:MAG: ABC transporter ATP-binding protein, partial [Leptospiraceae bacterium]|nr:ABC transporter ATP-binding protein [Leptospiraceae bacterium]
MNTYGQSITSPDAASETIENDTACLVAEDVSVIRQSRTILQSASLKIPAGQVVALLGPNGAGKSTLLRALAGLQSPADGRVTLQGRDLYAMRPGERARRLAWLAQQGEVTGELTVRETVELGRIAHLGLLGTPGAADRKAVEQAMAFTECGQWQDRRLQELSGGER